MPSDYQKQIKEIFGTADLDELRELAKMLKINNPNPRNAGRKAQLTPDQIVEVLELHRKGIGNTEIAKQIGVSCQTIYKYIYNAEQVSEQATTYFFELAMAQAEYDLAKENVASSDSFSPI